MAQMIVNQILVKNNPANVLSDFMFDITFECFANLPGVVDWKIIYIGSPTNGQYDQVIDSWDMDKLTPGVMNFTVQSSPPNFGQIPQDQIIGTTAILISVSYEKQEFFRCGYYVRNEYDQNLQEIPQQISLNDLNRYIWDEKPIIFRFEIEWVKKEGEATHDSQLLQKNLEIMGGDPFQQSNGALQQLDQMNFSYGMFNNDGKMGGPPGNFQQQ